MIPQVDFFSIVFWEKLKTPKRPFEISWPLPQALVYNEVKFFMEEHSYFYAPTFSWEIFQKSVDNTYFSYLLHYGLMIDKKIGLK